MVTKITNNIVCNNCVGARLYERLGIEFKNPFMWCVINPKDFRILMREWDTIDFSNYELKYGTLKGKKSYYIKIDGKVDVWYIHYIKNARYKKPTKINHVDLMYCDIEKYIKEKYESRLARMKSKPTFMCVIHDNWYYTNEEIKNTVNTNSKYDLIVSSNKEIGCDNYIKVTHPSDPIDKSMEIVEFFKKNGITVKDESD